MRNDWASQVQSWGQSAINDEVLLLQLTGGEAKFAPVLESLGAKENTQGVLLQDFADLGLQRLILVPLSGGLDSLVAYERAHERNAEVKPFYVGLNTPYREAELFALNSLGLEYEYIDYSVWPQNWKPYETKWSHILPLRNLLIIMSIAEMEGSRPGEIWLGATEGEIPKTGGDKSLRFFNATQLLLAALPVRHTLVFPLAKETKTDLVAWWISSGRDPQRLLATITCQNPQDTLSCGACHACFNRWIALTNNGLEEEMVYDPLGVPANQLKVKHWEAAYRAQDFSTWSERRIMQSLLAWYRAEEVWEVTRVLEAGLETLKAPESSLEL